MLISDINFDEDIINSCIEELQDSSITNRNNYFNKLVYDRLLKCNNAYMNDFDNELSKILDDTNNYNIKDLVNIINNFSKLMSLIYKSEMILYKIL